MLIGDNLPELGTNLVTALTSLNMNDFTHDFWLFDLFEKFCVGWLFSFKF